jgi:hypothetical protein
MKKRCKHRLEQRILLRIRKFGNSGDAGEGEHCYIQNKRWRGNSFGGLAKMVFERLLEIAALTVNGYVHGE